MISVIYTDDEPDLLEIGKLFLERTGRFSVDTAKSTREALDKIRQTAYDAIVSDYQMPGMNGIEFLKEVRASGNIIPFIIFTGRGREEIVIQALNEGADFYLQKGGDPLPQFAELAHKVEMAVQRRRAEISVRDHERREADIINFLPDATFAIDTNGVVIAWNRAMERMTGVRAEEIVGKDNYEYAVPFYHERRPILIDLVLNDDPGTAAKYPYIKKEGKTFFSEITIPHFNGGRGASLWFTASPLYNMRGTIVGAIESIREITERKKAEEALNESEEFLRSLIENIPDMIFVKDAKDLRFVRFNRAGEALLGYPREDLLGKNDYDFFPREEADFFTRKDRTVIESRTPLDIPREKIRTRLLGERVIHTKKIPILDDAGEPRYLLGISEDITERIKVEEALRESEQRYRNIVEDQTEFISRFRPDGTHVFVNEAYCRYFELQREEILGHRFRPAIYPEDRDRVQHFFESLTPDHPVDAIEHRVVMPDGSVRWQRWSDRAIFDEHGTLVEYQSVGRDITERKLAEEALRESQQRNAALIAALPDLLFVISRDGTYLDLQAADKSLLAAPPDRLIGKNIASAGFDPAIAAVILKAVSAAIDAGSLQQIEYTLAVPAGVHDFEARIVRLGDDRVLGIVRDITQQIAAEKAHKESEERFRSLYDNMIAGVVVYDATPDGSDFIIRDINRAAEKIEQVKKEEVIGHRVTEIFPGVGEFGILEVFRKVATTGVPARHPVSLYRDDRIIGWRENYITRLPSGEIVAIYEDLTEKKRAEGALQESRNLLDATERLAKVGGWEWDIARQTMTWTDETYRIHGFNRSEFAAGSPEHIQRSLACYDPADRSVIGSAFKSCVENGIPYDLEFPLTTADGRRLWVRTMGKPVMEGGRVVRVVGNIMDITERKQAETTVLESEERLRTIMQSVQAGIVLIDAKTHRILDANPKALTMIGASVRDVTGSVCHRFICPAEEGKCPLTDLHREIDTSECILVTCDGEEIPVLKTVVPANIGGSTVLVESFSDIRELKKKEDRIRVLGNLLDLIPASVTVHDAEGRFLFANAKTFEYHGYSAEEFYRINLHELDIPASEQLIEEHIRQVQETGETSFEAAHYRKDRSVLPLLVNAKITTWEGTPVILSVATDITERKRMEEELRSRERDYSTLADNSPDLIVRFDTELRHIYGNLTAERETGYSLSDTFGRRPSELPLPGPVAAFMEESLKKTLLAGTQQLVEQEFPTPQGPRFYETRIVPERDGTGAIVSLLAISRDITSRKRAEGALKESEERLRAIVTASSDAVYRMNADWTEMRQLIGRDFIVDTPKPSTSWLQAYIHPDDQDHVMAVIRKAIRTKTVFALEHRVRRVDGSLGWTFSRAVPILDPDGRIIEWIGTAADITERKQIEESMKKSEARFSTLFNVSPVPLMLTAPDDGRILAVNDAAASLFGHSRKDLLGKTTAELGIWVNPDERKAQLAIFKRDGSVRNVETQIRSGSGQVRTVIFNSVTADSNGVPAIITAYYDITDRKQAEDRMAAAYAEYQNLLDNIQDVYYRTDASGRLIRISRSMAATFGYNDISELLGKNVAEEFYFNPSDRDAVLQEISSKGNITNYEVRLKRKDGTPVWISANSHLWHNPDGSIGGVEGTFRDITEQKTISDALQRKTAELDYRNRVISTLLDTVPIGIFMVEATSGKPIVANKRATWLLGRGILPDATEENLAEVYEAYRAGTMERYPAKEMPVIRGMYGESSHIDDMEVVRPDGTRICLEVFGTPVFDSQGRVAASLVCFLDITDRKQTEEMIHRLAQFPEQNPLPVLRIAGDGTLLYANNPGKLWLAGFPGHRQGQVPEGIGALVTDTMEKQGIRTLEVQDEAGRVYVAAATRPKGEDFVNIYVSDITERKKAERIIIETNRKINLLTSITRHDVANQVTILQAFTQIALEHHPDPAIAGLLEKIRAAGDAISRQIEFTRAYQELGMHAPGWYAVRELVLRQKPAGITVTCTCDAEIYADPMLEKVFFNLIDNAARHGERVTGIAVRCEKSGADCVVTVEDNGVGVSPELKEKIFEKGYGKHTGFGLFLAREILAITGISIRENGISGTGARFELRVPAGGFRASSAGIHGPEP